MITEHNLIVSTFTTGAGVRVKIRHRLSGVTAESEVHSHRREAYAQAMTRLEFLLAPRSTATAGRRTPRPCTRCPYDYTAQVVALRPELGGSINAGDGDASS